MHCNDAAPERKLLGGFNEAEFKADGDQIAGYGSVFNVRDLGGDIVAPGAFAESLSTRGLPKLLWQHDPGEPIGVWTEAGEDDRGLRLAGEIMRETVRGPMAAALLARGAIDGLSIGYRTVEADRDEDGARIIRKAELWEVSLVTFPMNEAARADAPKSIPLEEIDKLDFSGLERLLREARGFSRSEAKRFMHRVGAIHEQREAVRRDEADTMTELRRLSARLASA